jgi:hypothetical protein
MPKMGVVYIVNMLDMLGLRVGVFVDDLDALGGLLGIGELQPREEDDSKGESEFLLLTGPASAAWSWQHFEDKEMV